MKEIKLGQRLGWNLHPASTMIALVDDSDYDWLSKLTWRAVKTKYTFYAVTDENVAMHTVIMEPPPGLITHHKDNNGLNNQRYNLINCTQANNIQAQQRSIINGYKGVCWHKKRKRWMAYIGHNGKQEYIGLFEDEDEAALAYNNMAIQYFGDFASLNKILTAEDKAERNKLLDIIKKGGLR